MAQIMATWCKLLFARPVAMRISFPPLQTHPVRVLGPTQEKDAVAATREAGGAFGRTFLRAKRQNAEQDLEGLCN